MVSERTGSPAPTTGASRRFRESHTLPSVPDVPGQRRAADMGDPIELTSGLERMRESGVRRVVGATRRGIVVQFLTESLMIYRLAGREAAAGRCSPLRVGRLADSSMARAEEATGMGAAKTVVIVSLAFVLLAASVRAAPTGQPSDLSQLRQAAEQGDTDAQATLGVWSGTSLVATWSRTTSLPCSGSVARPSKDTPGRSSQSALSTASRAVSPAAVRLYAARPAISGSKPPGPA